MSLDLRDRAALVLVAASIVLVGASSWLFLARIDAGEAPSPLPGLGLATASGVPEPTEAGEGQLVVDVEGAVARPGVVTLAAGSRVADAIRAAGGYAADADLAAAAQTLNLAALLSDGAQVYVPILGGAAGTGAGGGASTGSGLVNLNTASSDALEALPGIGPVTAEKIVAARGEQPFATLDELVDRKVMNRGQLDGIRALVTL